MQLGTDQAPFAITVFATARARHAALLLAAPLFVCGATLAQSAATARVSVPDSGPPWANDDSSEPALSSDGMRVAFESQAAQLVSPSELDGDTDIFLRDLSTRTTIRVTHALGGAEINDSAYKPSISADGRFVAYTSLASNIVAGDTFNKGDVFVFDTQTGVTVRASVSSTGAQAGGHSNFDAPALSADGDVVAFTSGASNLVVGDTNSSRDVFVHVLSSGSTERVSFQPAGPQWTGDDCHAPAVSSDGRYVAYRFSSGIYRHDRTSGTTARVDVPPGGGLPNGSVLNACSMSADGNLIAFTSYASNLVNDDSNDLYDVFVRDMLSGAIERASWTSAGDQIVQADSSSRAISGDGNVVVFASQAQLFPGDTGSSWNLFAFDRASATLRHVDADLNGGFSAQTNWSASVSFGGSRIAFATLSDQIVPSDTLGFSDVFVREIRPAVTSYCTAQVNSLGCTPAMSSSGVASATLPAAFTLGTTQVLGQVGGTLFYGAAAASTPYFGGTLCVAPPRARTGLQDSGGSAGTCTGVYQFDFNARIQAGVDPALIAGATIYCQTWSRDGASAGGTNLSDATSFPIWP